MLHKFVTSLALAGGLLLRPAPSSAQTADSLSLVADLGVVNTAGNTDLTTVNLGEQVRWRRGRLMLEQTFAMVYGRSDGETTSSLWRGGVRGDYALSDAVAAYTRVGYDRDRFAGISRRLEEGSGLALKLLRRTRDRLETEIGLSLVQQLSTLGSRDDFVSGRGAIAYSHHFAEATYLRQTLATLVSLEEASDYRVTSESALVAALSGRLALKVSYVVRFDHRPEPGFRTTDRLLTSGLQFTL